MQDCAIVLADDRRDAADAAITLSVDQRQDGSATLRTVVATKHDGPPLVLAEIVVLAWEPPTDHRDLADSALWLNGRQMNSAVFSHRFARPLERGHVTGEHRTETPDTVCYSASGGVAVLGTPRGCQLWGFLGGARQFSEIRVTVDRAEQTLLRVECVCLLDAWLLHASESVRSEELLIASGNDAASLLEQFATRAGALAAARIPPQPRSGWCSWYSLFNQTSADTVLANVAALRQTRLPLEIIQIDDGYQSATGDWLTPNDRFPDGMADLAQQIRDAGFAPGLWLAPLVLHRASATLRNHPDWAVRTRAGVIRYHNSWLGEIAALDCTHPAARAWLTRVIRTVVHDWGYGYLKLDALSPTRQNRTGCTTRPTPPLPPICALVSNWSAPPPETLPICWPAPLPSRRRWAWSMQCASARMSRPAGSIPTSRHPRSTRCG